MHESGLDLTNLQFWVHSANPIAARTNTRFVDQLY
ncbi:hypothetical protein [Ohtaekwangia koreensis]